MKVKILSAALCLLASAAATVTSAESVAINNAEVDSGQFYLAATQTNIKFRQLKGVRSNGEAIQIDPNSGVKLKMTSKSSAKLSAPGNAKGRKGDDAKRQSGRVEQSGAKRSQAESQAESKAESKAERGRMVFNLFLRLNVQSCRRGGRFLTNVSSFAVSRASR